jgi:hypothetical protein
MLFALVDYLNYRAERGPYSANAIESQGGHLADKHLTYRIEALRPADLFFYHGRGSLLSWAVMYFTHSIWSHVGTCVGDGKIVDATTSGVVEHRLTDYLDGRGYLAFRTVQGISDEQRADVARYARSTVGAGYNWSGVFRLFGAIITGYHAHFRWRFAVDVLIFAAMLATLGLLWPPLSIASFASAIVYLRLLLISWPSRQSMRRILKEQGVATP